MFMLSCLLLAASAVAHPALEARPPIIDYALPMGYYPPGPLLRSAMPVAIEDPKGEKHEEKGIVAAFADPLLTYPNVPVVHEVVIDNEPKKEEAEKPLEASSEKSETVESEKPLKPEDDKLDTVKIEVAHPPVVRVSWPSWLPQFNLPFKLPEIPFVSNILAFGNKPTTILEPASYRALPYHVPVVLK